CSFRMLSSFVFSFIHILLLLHAFLPFLLSLLFFFNDTATTEIYTLSLHDALPISFRADLPAADRRLSALLGGALPRHFRHAVDEIGRDTSELQSRENLVCRLLLEKKKRNKNICKSGQYTYVGISESTHF